MRIKEITEAAVNPDQELIDQLMPRIKDAVQEYLDSIDEEHDFNELEEILNSDLEDDFPVEFIADDSPRKNPREIVSAGASWDEQEGAHITLYLHTANLENQFERLIPEIEKKIAHETVHFAQYKKMGAEKLKTHRSGHQKGTELAKRTGRSQDWMRNYLRDPHELQAYGRDLAQEIGQTNNPQAVLRNPEQYRNSLPTYDQMRSVFPSNTPQIRQLLKYAVAYLKQQ
jgi:hypothetical protein